MANGVNVLERALRRVVRDLQALNANWAIVGGIAVGARAEPRTTRDVDVAVAAATDAEAEKLVRELQATGYRVRAIVEHETANRLATARLFLSDQPELLVDLLFASSGIENEIIQRADRLDILQGLTANFASTGHLLALNVLARDDRQRPQDLDDIRALLAEASARDIEEARQALDLIEQRGYARGRPLVVHFEEVLSTDNSSAGK